MASANLTKCEDCGKMVSVNAITCPSCGSPIQQQIQQRQFLKQQKEEELQRKVEAFKNRPESQKRQERILLSVVITLAICIYALVKFSAHPIMSIFLIIGSILICTPFKQLVQNKNPKLKNWMLNVIGGFLLFIGFMEITTTREQAQAVADTPKATEPTTATSKNTASATVQTKEQPKPNKDYSNVVVPYTQKGYPKLYAKWGADWVKKINAMMPQVVAKVASNPKCDAPDMVDLSDNRSVVKKEAVFFVDCKNGERFYVSQNELSGNNPIKSENEQLDGEPHEYIQACRDYVKNSLQFPSSFDDELLSTTSRKMPSGNIEVIMPFTAKNGLGNEIPQTARCLITTKKKIEVTLVNR